MVLDADRDAGGGSLDLGALASTAGRALVLQTSIAAGDQLEGTVAEVLAHDGPAVLRVHAPSAEGHAADATLARAREALAQAESDASNASDDSSDVPAPPAPTPATAPAPDRAAFAALEQRHAAELAALRGEYEARIAGLRASFQQETAHKIRRRLLQLATAQGSVAGAPEARPEEPRE